MRRFLPALIIIVLLLALAIDFWPGLKLPVIGDQGGGPRVLETKLGLDLQGGLRVEYQALPVDGKAPDAAAMATIRDIIERRVNSTGVSEPVVAVHGTDRVVVELPGATNREEIERLVGQTGQLDVRPAAGGPVRERVDDRQPHRRQRGSAAADRSAPRAAVHRRAPDRGEPGERPEHRPARRRVQPRRRGLEAVRRLHEGARRRVLRDRPRRDGHLGTEHQRADHRRIGPDHDGRRRRRHPAAQRARDGPPLWIAAVPDPGRPGHPDQRHARQGVPPGQSHRRR